MQQNVRVNVNNGGCCSGVIGLVALVILLSIFAGATGKLLTFLTSTPGIILIAALAIAAAIYFSRRRVT